MPYPKRLLNEGEEIALDLRPHWWFFWKHIATGILVFVLLVLITAKLRGHGSVTQVSYWFWGVIALVWAGWLAIKYLNWNATHFVVTSQRVIYRTGVLAKHGVEIPLERVNNINFHQGMFERLIGAGDLDIESAGRDGQSHFDDIWYPDAVQQEVYKQMEAYARKRAAWSAPQAVAAPAQAPPAPAAAAAPTVPEQLQQLAELRDKGIITAAEFETKKAQLLERM
ncbi:MAG TPA: PH domain-containing protein [Acidimicrobiia bacterium]|nr:PH domain-containing protein [Acidimicrobiia bacterium]